MRVFKSLPEGFAVSMEGQPNFFKVNNGTAVKSQCYAHDGKNGGYWISWTDGPISNSAPANLVNKALNSACIGAVAGMKGKETSRYTVNLQGGFPGRQIDGSLLDGKGFFRMRLYLVGHRLFQLAATGTEDYLKELAPNQFLSSLSPFSPVTTLKQTQAGLLRQNPNLPARILGQNPSLSASLQGNSINQHYRSNSNNYNHNTGTGPWTASGSSQISVDQMMKDSQALFNNNSAMAQANEWYKGKEAREKAFADKFAIKH